MTVMDRINYDSYMTEPEVAEICMACTKKDCPGICDDFRLAFRAIDARCIHVRRKGPGHYGKKLMAFGEAHSISEWAKLYGLKYHTLFTRMSVSGMTMEQALTYKRPKVMTITCGGETHTINEWARLIGVDDMTIRYRIQRGCSPEEAVRGRRFETV